MRESRPEQIILRRVLEHMYDRRIIGNVERRTYVELMIELALERLRPRWWAADTWPPWTLEQAETGARIAVRQSAALQTWSASAIASLPEFDIAPRNGYYVDGSSQWVEVQPPQRPADISSWRITGRWMRASPTSGCRSSGSSTWRWSGICRRGRSGSG